jgi:hypothetical protein
VTVLRLARYRVTREAYDAVMASMRLHTQHPLGLIMHGVSEVDGELQVAQVWDGAEYVHRYEQEILTPALEANDVSAAEQVMMIELEDLVTP